MYTLSDKGTGTARFTPSEVVVFNEIIGNLQGYEYVKVESFKDAVLLLVTHIQENGYKPKTEVLEDLPEVIKVDALRNSLKTYAERHDLPMEHKPIEIVLDSLNADRTKEIEVLPQIKENEILLVFDTPQLQTLQAINSNRSEELIKMDHEAEPIQNTVKGMLFNSATLGDWSGEFFTGLK